MKIPNTVPTLILSGVLWFPIAVQAIMFEGAEGMKPPQPSHLSSDQPQIGRALQGEVLRIEGNDVLVEDQSGNEVRFRVDDSTVKTGTIKEGTHIEARINNFDHAMSIRPLDPSGPAQ